MKIFNNEIKEYHLCTLNRKRLYMQKISGMIAIVVTLVALLECLGMTANKNIAEATITTVEKATILAGTPAKKVATTTKNMPVVNNIKTENVTKKNEEVKKEEPKKIENKTEEVVKLASNKTEVTSRSSNSLKESKKTETKKETKTTTTKKTSSVTNTYSGRKLTKSAGTIQGPSGKETYYNLNMAGVVRIMRNAGFDEARYPYWVREDGVKMLGDYVMVAASFKIRPRGSVIQCSLGKALVCDTGSFASRNPTQLDIAVNW